MKFNDFADWVQRLHSGQSSMVVVEEGAGAGVCRSLGTPAPAYDVSGEFNASAAVWSPPAAPPDFPSQLLVSQAVAAAAAEVRAGEGVEVTPPTDRGVKFTIHGSTVTVFATVDEVADALAHEYFPDFCLITDRGLDRFEDAGRVRFYESFFKGPNGISLKTGFGMGQNHVSVEIKGEAFEVYGVAPFARLLSCFQDRGYRWHLTRIDAAWDHHAISPQVMREAYLAGNMRSLTKRKHATFHDDLGEDGGQTFTFGKRGSSSFLRVYNRRGYNRLEMECRENRAKWMGLQLVNTPLEGWSEISMGNLRDFVDLVDAGSDSCITRRRLLPCWVEFVGACERVKIRLSDTFKSLSDCAVAVVERLKDQHRRLGRAVAVVRSLLGPEGFKDWVDEAEKAFEPRHAVRVVELRATVGSYAEVMERKITDLLFDRTPTLAL